jgi:hypothetical protein
MLRVVILPDGTGEKESPLSHDGCAYGLHRSANFLAFEITGLNPTGFFPVGLYE